MPTGLGTRNPLPSLTICDPIAAVDCRSLFGRVSAGLRVASICTFTAFFPDNVIGPVRQVEATGCAASADADRA
jgi:hypothetical protein